MLVKTPLELVIPFDGVKVLPVPVAEGVTVELANTLPNWSFTVTVAVTAVEPTMQLPEQAVIEPDDTARVDTLWLTAPWPTVTDTV